jgi:hypothetical protein
MQPKDTLAACLHSSGWDRRRECFSVGFLRFQTHWRTSIPFPSSIKEGSSYYPCCSCCT